MNFDIVELFKQEIKEEKKVYHTVNEISKDTLPATFFVILEAFKKKEMYLKDLGDGKHAVTCPWAHLHSGSTGFKETVLYEPNDKNGNVGFCCLHGSHDGQGEKTMRDVAKYFRITTEQVEKVQIQQKQKNENKEKEDAITKAFYRNISITDEYDGKNILVEEKKFMCKGEVLMFFGKPSSGKSLICFDLVKGFAAGKPFWGNRYTPLKPTKILYYNTDKDRAAFQDYWCFPFWGKRNSVENIFFMHQVDMPSDLEKIVGEEDFFEKDYSNYSFTLSDENTMKVLEKFIKDNGVEIVVIDSFYAGVGEKYDINKSQDGLKVVNILKKFAKRTNSLIIIVHHSGKTGGKNKGENKETYMGSQNINGHVTASLTVQTTEHTSSTISATSTVAIGKPGKLYGFQPFDLEIVNVDEINEKTQRLEHSVHLNFLKDDIESDSDIELAFKTKNQILKQIEKTGTEWLQFQEIKENISSGYYFVPTNKIHDYLDELVKEKFLEVPTLGKTKKFKLTQKGKQQCENPQDFVKKIKKVVQIPIIQAPIIQKQQMDKISSIVLGGKAI